MNVLCKWVYLLDHNPDNDPDRNLDCYPDNFAPIIRAFNICNPGILLLTFNVTMTFFQGHFASTLF